jgi:hypothetical protein
MKKQQISVTLIALLILGGCTALQAGPKFIWSSNVLRKADNMNWICVGTMRVGDIVNPVTWFWTPPARHYFVKQDNARLRPGSTSEWFVQENMIDYEEEQTTYYLLYDTVSDKTAYIASDATNEADIQKNMSNPDWKTPDSEWSKNTLRWLKDGKPLNPGYCNR